MNQFYFLILIFGIISLFYSLKSIFLVRRIEKYNEILEINLPSLDNGKVEILPLFYYKLKEFFNASYDEKNGLKTRGVIVLLVVIAVVCLINALFLNFNQLIFLIIGIYLGAVIGKKLELKALQNEFESTFPQALVILNGAISSGNNVIQALNDASQNVEGVLSREFKTITRSLSIGDDPTNVFAESYRRLPFQNYYFFLTAMLGSMNTCSTQKEILSRLTN
ncbi:MAG: type II secretion system F family protein, partial [Campylobacter sp.]|nr:type II secretion system F family protein [Campylobacter sp.]